MEERENMKDIIIKWLSHVKDVEKNRDSQSKAHTHPKMKNVKEILEIVEIEIKPEAEAFLSF